MLELAGIFWELVLRAICSVYIDRVPTNSNPAHGDRSNLRMGPVSGLAP